VQWYESEVRALERASEAVNGNRPPVFYGSSSIRLWDTLADDFDPRVLNLGFGGATNFGTFSPGASGALVDV
jgi:hypothetical protein